MDSLFHHSNVCQHVSYFVSEFLNTKTKICQLVTFDSFHAEKFQEQMISIK